MISGLYQFCDRWIEKGTVWIFSDPHFGDELYIGTEIVHRPTAEEIVKSINSKVGKDDTLIILGDVGDINYVSKLRGYKILIMGNHDSGKSNYQKKSIIERYNEKNYPTKKDAITAVKTKYGNSITIEDVHLYFDFDIYDGMWMVKFSENLFDEVYEGPLIISDKIILSHEPISVPGLFNIHGHVHSNNSMNDITHFNCCAEKINYTPINFNKWMKEGHLSKINTIHRTTIDKATDRKKKNGR